MKKAKFLLTLALLGSLVACGGSSNEPSSSTPSNNSSTNTPTSVQSSSAGEGDVSSETSSNGEVSSSESTGSEEQSSSDPTTSSATDVSTDSSTNSENPEPDIIYSIYVGDTKRVDMVENEATDKGDGRLAEYMAIGVDLVSGDSVTIKDNQNNSYLHWYGTQLASDGQAFSVTQDGTYEFYLKIYVDGTSSYVRNQNEDQEASYGVYIGDVKKADMILNVNMDQEENKVSEYMALDVALVANDSVTIKDSKGTTYLNWTNEDLTSGNEFKVTEDGTYSFYLKFYNDGSSSCYVGKATGPVVVTGYYLVGTFIDDTEKQWVCNEEYKLTVNEANENKELYTEYYFTITLEVDDVFKVRDDGNGWYSNFENSDVVYDDMGNYTCQKAGEYTIYLKVYLDGTTTSIWVNAPIVVDKTKVTVYLSVDESVTWGKFYIYYWAGPDTPQTWPGVAMEYDDSQKLYHFDIEKTYTNVIFTNGEAEDAKNKKTTDLVFDEENPVYYLQLDSGYGAWGKIGEKPTVPEVDTIRIEFELPSWNPPATNPRCHYWGSINTESENLFDVNAKSNMTLDSSTGRYYIDIDATAKLEGIIIIFNQKDDKGAEQIKQSVDITTNLPTGAGTYLITGEWSAAWQNGHFKATIAKIG